jgi:uncharacterized membrane protein YoaK (UPF0700 family)
MRGRRIRSITLLFALLFAGHAESLHPANVSQKHGVIDDYSLASTPAGTSTGNALAQPETVSNVSIAAETTSTVEEAEESAIYSLPKKKKDVSLQQKHLFIMSLASLSGVIEGICFRKYGCFPNMMTGNTVRCMSFLADNHPGQALFYAGLIMSYTAGGALFEAVDWYQKKKSPNQLSSNENQKSKSSTLEQIARIGLGIFCFSDLTAKRMAPFDRAVLIPMAIGYGMINAAGMDALEGGVVTNAITGHYTKLGLGFGERLMLWNEDMDGKPSTAATKPLSTSVRAVAVFASSIVVTGWVYRWIQATPGIQRFLPPMGTSFGIMYAFLLTWYSKCQEPAKVKKMAELSF